MSFACQLIYDVTLFKYIFPRHSAMSALTSHCLLHNNFNFDFKSLVLAIYLIVNASTTYPVGATVLSKYRLQELYRIRPVICLAVLVLLLRRVRNQASVPLIVRGSYEIWLGVQVRLLEKGKKTDGAHVWTVIVAREFTAIGRRAGSRRVYSPVIPHRSSRASLSWIWPYRRSAESRVRERG